MRRLAGMVPSAVVPFVHKDNPDEKPPHREMVTASPPRLSNPKLDLAIRDYAPGAEVVVDGLVYGSAGVNPELAAPAAADAVAEVQSLKWFWECSHCGAADTTRLFPERSQPAARPWRARTHADSSSPLGLRSIRGRSRTLRSSRCVSWNPSPSAS